MSRDATLSGRKFQFFKFGLAAQNCAEFGHAEAEFLPDVNCKNVASGNCYWQALALA